MPTRPTSARSAFSARRFLPQTPAADRTRAWFQPRPARPHPRNAGDGRGLTWLFQLSWVPGLGHDQTSFIHSAARVGAGAAGTGGTDFNCKAALAIRNKYFNFPLCVNGKAGQRPAASAAEAFRREPPCPMEALRPVPVLSGIIASRKRRDLCEIAIGEELHHLWAGLRMSRPTACAAGGDALRDPALRPSRLYSQNWFPVEATADQLGGQAVR